MALCLRKTFPYKYNFKYCIAVSSCHVGGEETLREVLVREGRKPQGRCRGLGDKKWTFDKWVGIA